jgi:hypothetical protein
VDDNCLGRNQLQVGMTTHELIICLVPYYIIADESILEIAFRFTIGTDDFIPRAAQINPDHLDDRLELNLCRRRELGIASCNLERLLEVL